MVRQAMVMAFAAWLLVGAWMMHPASAMEVDWVKAPDVDLGEKALDIAVTADGETLFALMEGKVVVYSFPDESVVQHIPLSEPYSRIAFSDATRTLVLSGNPSGKLTSLRIEFIRPIDVTGLPYRGPADAPVTIVVFDDYECGYCAKMEPLLEQVLELYPEEVKLVVKHLPLAGHGHAARAATAALAAALQGKFWEYHKALFAHQDELGMETYLKIAKAIGLDLDRFQRDMHSGIVVQLLKQDLATAARLGVRGTPTVFINGRRLEQRNIESFSEAIDRELAAGNS